MKKITILLLWVLSSIIPLSLSQAQTIKEYIDNNWQDERYTDHRDGTVTDKYTQLIWKKCSQGQSYDSINNTCTGTASTCTWKDALQQGESEVFPTIGSSYSDWRLPNIEELRSLSTLDRYNPAININLFPNTKLEYYWSSSPYAYGSGDAWGVYFNYGYDGVRYRGYNYYVRLVRAGQLFKSIK